jgi:hypothetical protein
MTPGGHIVQLDRDAYTIAVLANAAIDDIADAKLFADLLQVKRIFPCTRRKSCARSRKTSAASKAL